MDNKAVAKHELSFLGGKPKVNRHYNVNNDKRIDVLSVNTSASNDAICTTIGLNGVDIGLISRNKSLRVELIATANIETDQLGNIVSSIAFDIMDTSICSYGMIIPNVINYYIKDTEMKHALLMSPIFWPNYRAFEDEDVIVTWLMIVPISDSERSYIEKNGIDSFDHLMEFKKIDIINYYRKSIL